MNYSKKCWACGKVPMEATGSYFKCSSCGATWNFCVGLGAQEVERGSISWVTDNGEHHRMPAHHVTKAAARKAAKARALKKAKA